MPPEDGTDMPVEKAIAHPARIRILRRLSQLSPGSPNQLWQSLGREVPNVSTARYHFRVLEKAGLIWAVDDRPDGGSVEHLYELTRNGERAVAEQADAA